jgi:hypothetical protein
MAVSSIFYGPLDFSGGPGYTRVYTEIYTSSINQITMFYPVLPCLALT